jgi:ribosome-associated protein
LIASVPESYGSPPLRVTLGGKTAKDRRIPLTPIEQARRIAALAGEKLAQDIVVLDMRSVCDFTDYFVICSGRNPRQTKAIFDEVYTGMKRERHLPRSTDGEREGYWVVADYLDVVVHVFTPETRAFYALDDLWSDVPQVELEQAATG